MQKLYIPGGAYALPDLRNNATESFRNGITTEPTRGACSAMNPSTLALEARFRLILRAEKFINLSDFFKLLLQSVQKSAIILSGMI